ncbi:MAG: hypothetical protein OXI60_04115, partial [Acidiferrobacterales bacterium]|nr:hypothetical protein [Acidiferrobacterales bacterium]
MSAVAFGSSPSATALASPTDTVGVASSSVICIVSEVMATVPDSPAMLKDSTASSSASSVGSSVNVL